MDKERLSYEQVSQRGDNPVNLPRISAPPPGADVREMAVTKIIPKHPLACWRPQRSVLPERPPVCIWQKNKMMEKYGHLLEVGAADGRKAVDGQKTRSKPRSGWRCLEDQKPAALSTNLMSTYYVWGHCQMLQESLPEGIYSLLRRQGTCRPNDLIIISGGCLVDLWSPSCSSPVREHYDFIFSPTFRTLFLHM